MSKIKLKLWSQEEVDNLKKLFPVMTTAKLAAELNRSVKAIGQKAYNMRIMKTWRDSKAWSKAEIARLKKLFPSMSSREVAKELNRSEKSVNQKAFKMQIKKSKKYLKSIGKA